MKILEKFEVQLFRDIDDLLDRDIVGGYDESFVTGALAVVFCFPFREFKEHNLFA